MPRPAFKEVLLGNPAVQAELKITAAQNNGQRRESTASTRKDSEGAPRDHGQGKIRGSSRQYLQGDRGGKPRESGRPSSANGWTRSSSSHRARWPSNRGSAPAFAAEGPDPIERLKLTDDQIKQIRAIAAEGDAEISKAAELPIVLDPKDGHRPPSRSRSWSRPRNSKRPRRRPAKPPGKPGIRSSRAIEQVLTETQRTAYREMLGPPFDLYKIRFSDDETSEDAGNVASALNMGGRGGGGGGGGQQSDPTFDTKVARPSLYDGAPSCPFRRGTPQLPHGRRPLQAVRRGHRQRRLQGHPEQGEVHEKPAVQGRNLDHRQCAGCRRDGRRTAHRIPRLPRPSAMPFATGCRRAARCS